MSFGVEVDKNSTQGDVQEEGYRLLGVRRIHDAHASRNCEMTVD